MLKIYKHIKAQAQIKVKVGEGEKGEGIFQLVKFTGGRVLGTDKGVTGGSFHTQDERLQKAIEQRSDFGKVFFIDHKIQESEDVLPEEKDYKIYPGVDTINRVKNTLKDDFGDKIKGEDLRGTEEMLKFCKRVGAAFPDFFTVEQGKFAKVLEEKADVVEPQVIEGPVVENTPEEPVVETPVETPEEPEVETQSVEVDPDELRAMKRGELNDYAAEFGIKDPEFLPNKEAVVQAILKLAE